MSHFKIATSLEGAFDQINNYLNSSCRNFKSFQINEQNQKIEHVLNEIFKINSELNLDYYFLTFHMNFNYLDIKKHLTESNHQFKV